MTRAACLALGLALLAGPAMAAPPTNLDAEVNALRAQAGVPGAAIGIVEDGHTVLARGFGVTALGGATPVDGHTLFEIGSTTKAMTVAALAQQVDAGKLGWDDPVTEHLPGFGMADPWVERAFTLRDMLTHHAGLGLGAGDLIFMTQTDFTRVDVLSVLRHLPPRGAFRASFAYNNLMYVAAGVLLERLSGESWEDYVTHHLFTPIGMTESLTDKAQRDRHPNRAQPHARLGPPARGIGAQHVLDEHAGLPRFIAPAGGVMSNAADMSRWIATLLAHGRLPRGARLWSEASARTMWTGVTPFHTDVGSNALGALTPDMAEYALGWQVLAYRGHLVITHAGGTSGFLTQVVLLPDRNTGFFIVQNSEDREFVAAMKYRLIDHYLGLAPTDWGQFMHAQAVADRARAEATLASPPATPDARPPLPLATYAGAYADPWFGGLTVTVSGGALEIAMTRAPRLRARLTHVSGDTFRARWEDATAEPADLTFALTAQGRVREITLQAVSPLADFSFDYADLAFTPVP